MTETIYTTGAFCQPVKINGVFRWVVTEFNDDTFRDGKYVDIKESADSEDGLIIGGD